MPGQIIYDDLTFDFELLSASHHGSLNYDCTRDLFKEQ